MKKTHKILSASRSVVVEPLWLIPSSWGWIFVTSSSVLIIVVLIPRKSIAEYFFWNRNFIDTESCNNDCADLIVSPSAFR